MKHAFKFLSKWNNFWLMISNTLNDKWIWWYSIKTIYFCPFIYLTNFYCPSFLFALACYNDESWLWEEGTDAISPASSSPLQEPGGVLKGFRLSSAARGTASSQMMGSSQLEDEGISASPVSKCNLWQNGNQVHHVLSFNNMRFRDDERASKYWWEWEVSADFLCLEDASWI